MPNFDLSAPSICRALETQTQATTLLSGSALHHAPTLQSCQSFDTKSSPLHSSWPTHNIDGFPELHIKVSLMTALLIIPLCVYNEPGISIFPSFMYCTFSGTCSYCTPENWTTTSSQSYSFTTHMAMLLSPFLPSGLLPNNKTKAQIPSVTTLPGSFPLSTVLTFDSSQAVIILSWQQSLHQTLPCTWPLPPTTICESLGPSLYQCLSNNSLCDMHMHDMECLWELTITIAKSTPSHVTLLNNS